MWAVVGAAFAAAATGASAEGTEWEPPPLPPLKLEARTAPLPHLKWDQEVICGQFAPVPGVHTGTFRLQCDPARKECLAAPGRVLDSEGAETEDELGRVHPCTARQDWPARMAEGYRFFPAVAEVQPGWIRDERGRAMQYNFDLNRRAWLGALYAPIASQLDPAHHRLRADLGVEVEVPSDDHHTLYRWHLLEGEIYLGAPTYDATLVRFDWSEARSHPLFFITTFVGKPQRHDVNVDVGAWFEAVHLEYLRRSGETESFLTLGTAAGTLDLWHSKDLASFVRLRAGVGAEYDTFRNDTSLKPLAAVEGDLTLDADGFHHVRFQAEGEKLYLSKAVPGRSVNPERLRLSAGYEVIIFAINDQPVTLVLDAKGTYRDDFVSVGPGWEGTVGAGLRFSLWAPARRSAPVQAKQ